MAKYLGGGEIHPIVTSNEKRLVIKTTHYGKDTTVQKPEWRRL